MKKYYVSFYCLDPTGSRRFVMREEYRWLMGFPSEWAIAIPGQREWRNWQDLMRRVSKLPESTA